MASQNKNIKVGIYFEEIIIQCKFRDEIRILAK